MNNAGEARRLIEISSREGGEINAWVKDDFHHFVLNIHHDGTRIRDVSSSSPRHPYSTCPSAGEQLQSLIGAPFTERATDIGKWLNMRLQCTHLFDLAGL